ncbi:hypothetical protein E4S40_02680 [Algoriphagus kandeliae]|uniref:Uncharacterized protein n=1 Tax=Algoriphagus kandeliae TaxID=2562278 RepID=A0A4Y9QYJ7_9BACT|nr:hypothetical protein [Algoriphagus kandeliae]TFV97574.1 hypothetical protein E4S40_02680 [Algoriphagus kandeliae]
MENLPKFSEMKAPEGYFETLPDSIFEKVQPQQNWGWVRWAAIFIVFISIGAYFFYPTAPSNELIALEEEVNLYIDANYWTAEDILSMSDQPDLILDELIEEEMPILEEFLNDEYLTPTEQ